MEFKLTRTEYSASTHYALCGPLDERAKLTPFSDGAKDTLICLDGVSRLNSLGTRIWCEWIRLIPVGVSVTIEKCRFMFVHSFNDVFGSLPAHVKVKSFYVPYVSETTGERADVLYEEGIHFKDGHLIESVRVFDSAQRPMEIDVLPEYFEFLSDEIRSY